MRAAAHIGRRDAWACWLSRRLRPASFCASCRSRCIKAICSSRSLARCQSLAVHPLVEQQGHLAHALSLPSLQWRELLMGSLAMRLLQGVELLQLALELGNSAQLQIKCTRLGREQHWGLCCKAQCGRCRGGPGSRPGGRPGSRPDLIEQVQGMSHVAVQGESVGSGLGCQWPGVESIEPCARLAHHARPLEGSSI